MGKERQNTPADDGGRGEARPLRERGFVRVRGAREHNL
jgi:hypothetical protein